MGKIGEGHAAAMGRLGLHELQSAVYPESNVAQHPELGTFGTATPQEVCEMRHGSDREESMLESRLQQAQEQVDQTRDQREPGMDMGNG